MYPSSQRHPGNAFNAFTDLERLSHELSGLFGVSRAPSSTRLATADTFPAINVGHTAQRVEVLAFAPGLDPAKIEITLDRGVLTLAGERPPTHTDGADPQVSVHTQERLSGRFKRTLSLPDDADPQQVQASYRDGVLRISIARREAAKPQRIVVQ